MVSNNMNQIGYYLKCALSLNNNIVLTLPISKVFSESEPNKNIRKNQVWHLSIYNNRIFYLESFFVSVYGCHLFNILYHTNLKNIYLTSLISITIH